MAILKIEKGWKPRNYARQLPVHPRGYGERVIDIDWSFSMKTIETRSFMAMDFQAGSLQKTLV